MSIAIEELPMSQLGQYAAIDIAFEVERILEVTPLDAGLGGLVLVERQLERPYTKDYDAVAGQGAAEAWAISRGCRELEVETQNINLPACRFYARQGCVLVGIQRFAYPAFPDETRLLWHKALTLEPEPA